VSFVSIVFEYSCNNRRCGDTAASGIAVAQSTAEVLFMSPHRHTVRAVALALAVAWLLPLTFAACGKTVGETIDDATITARVKTALLNDPQVGGMKIDVDTAQGIVTMSGVVKNKAEESRAIELARQTPGVKDVKSTMQVGSQ
jgi:hyperosmotically inducible protein